MLEIVFTGGPSTGKTSVINPTIEYFKELGYKVIVVQEAATIAINGGIKPFDPDGISGKLFQKIILKRQLVAEETARMAAKELGDRTIILYDRGTLDGYAYVKKEEWDEVLRSENVSTRELLTKYDAILYLENASQYFTKENNAARYEKDAEDAALKGEKVLQSYIGHDNLVVIQPRERLKDKQQEVINIIQNILGEPISIRNQRKYLVDDVDVEKISYATKVVITQDYLKEENNLEYRVRSVDQEGDISYHYQVQKKLTDGTKEIISESLISEREYLRYLENKSDSFETIVKSRYSFVYNKQYYKLDVFDDGLMILEVNVTKENPVVELPNFLSVVEEVTNNQEYSNITISRRRKKASYGKRKINSN